MNSDDDHVVASIRQRLIAANEPVTSARIEHYVREYAVALGDEAVADISHALERQLLGAGALQQLLDLPGVTDVLVNGPEDIWVDRGQGLQRTRVTLGSDADLRTLAMRLAANAGCRLDDACPTADGRLPDGTRFHAVLAPLVDVAAVISLRVPQRQSWQLPQLVEQAMIPALWEPILAQTVAARIGVVVSGATGAGKTTVLAALLRAAGAYERIVLIEESRELMVEHPHLVALQSRRVNAEGSGEITLSQLVKESLRMRPDRIVVGEVRGAEIRELLLAFNTGHRGGAVTLHANSAQDVPARLVSLGQLAGLSPAVVADQATTAFSVVMHVRRDYHQGQLRRFVSNIAVLAGHGDTPSAPGSVITSRDALTWRGYGPSREGPGWAELQRLLTAAQQVA